MSASTLLPCIEGIALDSITSTHKAIVLRLSTVSPYAACPLCGFQSGRVHSRYQRTLADMPWNQVAVRMHLRSRKFFCDNPACERVVFTELLPKLAARYARKTLQLQDALYLIGYIIGGKAGARVAVGLGLCVSPDTLLRRVRQVAQEHKPSTNGLRIVGVDDWAFRKGHRYGTILVDLERRCLAGLLPDRSSESLAAWLKQHPHIEIVSRDRAGVYADGARQGAPQAQQVADRWHLLRNLGEAMERLTAQHGRSLRQAAEQLSPTPVPQPIILETSAPALPPVLVEQRRLQRCEKRLAQYTQIKQLRQQGLTIASIAAEVGVSKRTADRFLQAEQYPERARRSRQPRNTDPYLPYIQQRVAQGGRSAQQLYGEIKAQGYTGSYASVYHLFQNLAPKQPGATEPKSVSNHNIGPEPRERRKRGRASPQAPVEVPPSRTVAWWLQGHLSSHAERRAQQGAFLNALYTLVPLLQEAAELAQEFRRLLKQRQVEPLNEWLKKASASVCTEIKRFAQGLYQDLCAVQNAITLEWSNGQTEGQVNRLKMLKRQMYGRANFDLLRARVLPVGQAA